MEKIDHKAVKVIALKIIRSPSLLTVSEETELALAYLDLLAEQRASIEVMHKP